MRSDRRILRSAVCMALAPMALGAACWLGAARAAAATASPWVANPQSQLRLISADRVAPRRGELRLGIQFRLAPRWHVYWKNSGDAGFAPMVSFSPQPGLAAAELLWPAPHRYELPGGLEAFGYAGEMVYPVRAALDGRADGGMLRLTADVDYLVCEVDCVPHRYELTIDQPLGDRAQPDPETAPLLDRWFHQLPLAADRQAGVQARAELAAAAPTAPARPSATGAASGAGQPSATGPSFGTGPSSATGAPPAAELLFALRLRGVTAAAGAADLFFETHPTLEAGRPRARQAADGLIFEVPVRRKDSSAPLPAVAEMAWTATGLMHDGRPLALAARERLPLAGTPAGEAREAGRDRGGWAAAPSASGLRDAVAAADPLPFALAAMAAALLALERWGLLRRPRRGVAAEATLAAQHPEGGGRIERAAQESSAPPLGRVAIGFLALLLAVAALYALSLEISVEGLAGVELALLAAALLAWLRRQAEPRRVARALLATGLAACIVAAPWLAANSRRAVAPRSRPVAGQASSAAAVAPAARAPS